MNRITENEQLLLSPTDFWRTLDGKIGRGTIYKMLNENKIKHLRIGRKVLIPFTEVTEFLKREMNQ